MDNVNQTIVQEAINSKINTPEQLAKIKRQVSGRFGIASPPSDHELRRTYRTLVGDNAIEASEELEAVLQSRAIRTLSGVAPITVLTKPYPCPGKCIYCPYEATMPKSYLSNEPAAARALFLEFDPYIQVQRRIETMEDNGHPTDKIELIVKGGTWSYYPADYQEEFIRRCFEACNDYDNSQDHEIIKSSPFVEPSLTTEDRQDQETLEQTQISNETAAHRIIGLTLETRPDYINEEEVARLRMLGCTRIELGVQATDDKVLELIKRGHDVASVRRATKLLKDAGFKVDYHMMPMLPGSDVKHDLEMLRGLFTDTNFCPDMIKIYPCVVMQNAELYEWMKDGRYTPYSNEELFEMLIEFKTDIPRYVRISRLIRDIPSTSIKGGNKITNLREIIRREMERRNLHCNCLRCREVGHVRGIDPDKLEPVLFVDEYEASGGREFFLSFEDKDRQVVYAFCRLRLPGKQSNETLELLPEIDDAALIRELHTYGHLVKIDTKDSLATQHTGLGTKLMNEAEKIAKQNEYKKMAVISGVGVRVY